MIPALNRREPGFNVLHQVSEHVYTFVTPFLFMGKVPLNNRSVVIHMPAPKKGEKGTLVIINPAELLPEIEQALRRLEEQTDSTIRYLISPGDWHYLFIGQHVKAFPAARAYVPPGRIPSKNPGFPYTLIDVATDNPFPELAPHLITQNFKGLADFTDPNRKLPRHELVFFHPASRVITSGDVLYYNGQGELSPAQKAIGQLLHVLDFHYLKWKMVLDPGAVQRSIENILRWDFEHYISIHGEPGNVLEREAKAHIEKILAWAKAPPADFPPAAG